MVEPTVFIGVAAGVLSLSGVTAAVPETMAPASWVAADAHTHRGTSVQAMGQFQEIVVAAGSRGWAARSFLQVPHRQAEAWTAPSADQGAIAHEPLRPDGPGPSRIPDVLVIGGASAGSVVAAGASEGAPEAARNPEGGNGNIAALVVAGASLLALLGSAVVARRRAAGLG